MLRESEAFAKSKNPYTLPATRRPRDFQGHPAPVRTAALGCPAERQLDPDEPKSKLQGWLAPEMVGFRISPAPP